MKIDEEEMYKMDENAKKEVESILFQEYQQRKRKQY